MHKSVVPTSIAPLWNCLPPSVFLTSPNQGYTISKALSKSNIQHFWYIDKNKKEEAPNSTQNVIFCLHIQKWREALPQQLQPITPCCNCLINTVESSLSNINDSSSKLNRYLTASHLDISPRIRIAFLCNYNKISFRAWSTFEGFCGIKRAHGRVLWKTLLQMFTQIKFIMFLGDNEW